MVNPGAFRGSRKTFLLSCKPQYEDAVKNGFAADALANIQRRYFKRYPVYLDHNEEPSDDWLASVDDDAPDAELALPNRELLGSDEAYEIALQVLKQHQEVVVFRKGQIKRWLAYQYMKDHSLSSRESGAYNPYRTFINKISGVSERKPNAKSKVNTWRAADPDHNIAINTEANRRIEEQNKTANKFQSKNLAALRDKIARELFNALLPAEQAEWADRAKEEHELAVAEWKREQTQPPSTDPVDRQRAINGVIQVMQGALDGLNDLTGWKWSLIGGGPEPADGGRLNMISIHSGKTNGPTPMNFGRFQGDKYRSMFVPMFGHFLQNCFTVDECRARALPDAHGHLGLAGLGVTDEHADNSNPINFDRVPQQLRVATAPSDTVRNNLLAAIARTNDMHLQEQQPRPSAPQPTPDTSASMQSISPSHLVLPLSEAVQTSSPERDRSIASPPAPPSRLSTPIPLGVAPGPQVPNRRLLSPPRTPQHTMPALGSLAMPLASPNLPPITLAQVTNSTSEDINNHAINIVAPEHPENEGDQEAEGTIALPVGGELDEPLSGNQGAAPVSIEEMPAKRKRGRPSKQDRTHREVDTNPVNPLMRRATRSTTQADVPVARRTRSAQSKAPLVQLRLPETKKRRLTEKSAAKAGGSEPQSWASRGPTPIETVDESTASRPLPQVTAFENEYSDTPDWFQQAGRMFLSHDLGSEWEVLLSSWIMFEKVHGFAEGERIKTCHRPAAVGEWIRRERNEHWRPEINNLLEYEEDFERWWATLQPSWRVDDSEGVRFEQIDGDWDVLKCAGANGLLSAVAALFFWGYHLSEEGDSYRDLWRMYVQDCKVVLEVLLH